MTSVTTIPDLRSRAVLRRIEAGSMALCTECGQQVKFAAKLALLQAIANVYIDGRWNRVEHYHQDCYLTAGEPHGPAVEQPISRVTRSSSM